MLSTSFPCSGGGASSEIFILNHISLGVLWLLLFKISLSSGVSFPLVVPGSIRGTRTIARYIVCCCCSCTSAVSHQGLGADQLVTGGTVDHPNDPTLPIVSRCCYCMLGGKKKFKASFL